MEWRKKDRYQRILGQVYLDDRWINLEMVQEGWAWHYKQYSKDQRLADAEDAARAAGVGLWADPHPTPPWDFRRGDRPEGATGDQITAADDSTMVYVTKSGTKYHTDGCSHLGASRIAISLGEATSSASVWRLLRPPFRFEGRSVTTRQRPRLVRA